MTRHLLLMALGLATSFAAAACEGGVPAESPRTTSPQLAVSNLHSQISSLERQLELDLGNMATRERLVGLLLARTQFFGTMDDFTAAFSVVEEAIAYGLAPGRTAVLHARVLAAVHRFDEAIDELERAEALGVGDLSSIRQSIELAIGGDPTPIIDTRIELALALPSYSSHTKLAAALAADQRHRESDNSYRDAILEYGDVSPFPFAWVAFQRGLMWGESAGDSEHAYDLYQDAVVVLPQYVVANVHLAELDFERGHVDAAIARLEAIVDETQDPEPASRLAAFLAEDAPEQAALYAERARAGYEHYLSQYPLAFADHAAEFYLGAGENAGRALQLAQLNLDNRKTPRAYRLAVEAAIAADEHDLACEFALMGHLEVLLEGC